MRKLKKSLLLLIGLLSVFVLFACRGGEGSSAVITPILKTAYFTDAAISGLPYSCGYKSGTTDEDGSFNFIEGADCTFKFGTSSITIDSSDLSTEDIKITPFDIKEFTSNPEHTVRFMQLIQSLDNPADNNIDLSNLLGKNINLRDDLDNDEALAEIFEAIKESFSDHKATLVSPAEALTHFTTTHSSDERIIGKIPKDLHINGFVNPNSPMDSSTEDEKSSGSSDLTDGSSENSSIDTEKSDEATNSSGTSTGESIIPPDKDNIDTTISNNTDKTSINAMTRAQVVDCSSLTAQIGSKAVSILVKHSYKKCAMVAGILIANSNTTLIDGKDITEETQLMADILAELLDNNQDGVMDEPTVVAYLKTGANGSWINMQSAANENNEGAIVEELLPYLGRDMGVKYSWLTDNYSTSEFKTGIKERHMLVEEALHLIHMMGYSKAYPKQWGVSDIGCTNQENSSDGCNYNQSTLTKLAWEATTKSPIWSAHGENRLSGGKLTGTCAAPSCMAIEFIMNTLVVYRNIRTSDDSHGNFPTSQLAVTNQLNSTTYGKEMKKLFDGTDSLYGQIPNGMTWKYNPKSTSVENDTSDLSTQLEGKTVESLATSLSKNVTGRNEATLATGHTFVSIPAATFTMGDSRYSMLAAAPEHRVTISKEYWISKNMVTNAEFKTFVSETQYISDLQKSNSEGCFVYIAKEKGFAPTKGRYYANAFSNTPIIGDHPVVCISYNDAVAYTNWLSTKLGLTVSLPTEAQWELAAKGTTQRKFPWGDEDPTGAHANFADKQFSIDYAGSQQGKPTLTVNDGYGATSPVGTYPLGASPYGVLDMAGNASEWVLNYFEEYTSTETKDPTGPTSGEARVNRGGNWVDDFSATEEQHTIITVSRASDSANSADDHMGFRIVINP